MAPLIAELQRDAVADFPVSDLLRKCYLLARKLKADEFADWTKREQE